MNKEEYREEVLRQMKEQNQRLWDIEVMLIFIALLIGIVLIAVVWQNCSIGSIREDIRQMSISDIPYRVLDYVKWINDRLTVIEAHVKTYR